MLHDALHPVLHGKVRDPHCVFRGLDVTQPMVEVRHN
jgi:hypothetical protein